MQKIIKTGNSFAVTIPAFFVKKLNLKLSDPVEVKVDFENAKIEIHFPASRQLPLQTAKKSG